MSDKFLIHKERRISELSQRKKEKERRNQDYVIKGN